MVLEHDTLSCLADQLDKVLSIYIDDWPSYRRGKNLGQTDELTETDLLTDGWTLQTLFASQNGGGGHKKCARSLAYILNI